MPEIDQSAITDVLRWGVAKKMQRGCKDHAASRGIDSSCLGLFGELLAGSVGHHRQMCIARPSQSKALLQPDLARRRVEQIGSANDGSDPLRSVVDNNRQLVGKLSVGTQENEIANSFLQILPHAPLYPILKRQLMIRHAHSPGARHPSHGESWTTGSRV